MTPLGVLAGAILVTDGTNSISKEVARYATNNTTSEGLVANAAMSTAEFMGFSRENGLGVYKSISLAAHAYTIFGLLRRLVRRLFRYLLLTITEGEHTEPPAAYNENSGLWRES